MEMNPISTNSMGQSPGIGSPEIAGFDFMKFMLGLQAQISVNLDDTAQTFLSDEWNPLLLENKTGDKKEMSDLLSFNPLVDLTNKNPLETLSLKTESDQKPGAVKEGTVMLSDLKQIEQAFTQVLQGKNEGTLSDDKGPVQITGLKTGKENPLHALLNQSSAETLQVQEKLMNQKVSAQDSRGLQQYQSMDDKGIGKGFSRQKSSKDGFDPGLLMQIPVNGTFSQNLTHLNSANVHATAGAPDLTSVFSQVNHLASKGGGEMTVLLSPPELGSVEVQVVTKGNQVEIQMRSENEWVRGLLENSLPDLKQSLHAQDLVLTRSEFQTSTNDPSSGSFGNFAGNDSSRSATKERNSADIEQKNLRVKMVPQSKVNLAAVSAPGRLNLKI